MGHEGLIKSIIGKLCKEATQKLNYKGRTQSEIKMHQNTLLKFNAPSLFWKSPLTNLKFNYSSIICTKPFPDT